MIFSYLKFMQSAIMLKDCASSPNRALPSVAGINRFLCALIGYSRKYPHTSRGRYGNAAVSSQSA